MNPSTSRRFLHQDCWATAMVTVVVVALLGELGAGFVSCERVRMREGREERCSDVARKISRLQVINIARFV